MDIFEVTPAPLTATGATAEGRAYDGTNSVEITGVTLAGILNGDDVSVDTTGLTGTLNGSNAGTYTNLTLPAMTLTGADAENYTVTRPAGAVPASVTIRKAAARCAGGHKPGQHRRHLRAWSGQSGQLLRQRRND